MINIGLMGALLSNENMGCVALTYSLTKMLQNFADSKGLQFRYTIFEFQYDEDKYKKLADFLCIPQECIEFAPVGFCLKENYKLMIKMTKVNIEMIKKIKKCDLVIDITQGDSFTDIYGNDRFYRLTVIKELVTKYKIPLILGPQTYGPFLDEKNKIRAKKIIEKSSLVISRDEESKEYINSFCSKKITVTTDLAFSLPYKTEKISSKKIKVGINPSGLLFSKKSENTNLNLTLSVDYDKYINEIINILSSDDKFEIHLIPHVGNDALNSFKDNKNLICHKSFQTPIEAKNCISGMDIFIGSRMHATIAAFSSAVATIPVAYSRKFSGLYNTLGYNYVIDLNNESTENAIIKTIDMVNHYNKLLKKGRECFTEIERKKNLLEITMNDYLEYFLKNSSKG